MVPILTSAIYSFQLPCTDTFALIPTRVAHLVTMPEDGVNPG